MEDIEDIWQTAIGSSYWRGGPVLKNAIASVDEALWDIKGKIANMPVYQLLGGRCCEGAAVYRHAHGKDMDDMEQNIRNYMAQGFRYLRVGCRDVEGVPNEFMVKTANPKDGAYFNPENSADHVDEMVRQLTERFKGENIHF